MNFKQTILAGLIILAGAITYEWTNTPHTFAVWPSDSVEFTIKCYPLSIEVYEWDEKLFSTTDTQRIIETIMKHHENCLPLVLIKDQCADIESDTSFARKSIYQLIEGAPCIKELGLIAYY